jgi:hypothetical protein
VVAAIGVFYLAPGFVHTVCAGVLTGLLAGWLQHAYRVKSALGVDFFNALLEVQIWQEADRTKLMKLLIHMAAGILATLSISTLGFSTPPTAAGTLPCLPFLTPDGCPTTGDATGIIVICVIVTTAVFLVLNPPVAKAIFYDAIEGAAGNAARAVMLHRVLRNEEGERIRGIIFVSSLKEGATAGILNGLMLIVFRLI